MNNDTLFQQRLAMITSWQPTNPRESMAMKTLLTSCLSNKLGTEKKKESHQHVHYHRNTHY